MKTVLYLSHTGQWGGGAEVVLCQIMQAAAHAGYTPHLAAPAGELLKHTQPISASVTVVRMPSIERTGNPFRALAMVAAVVRAQIAMLVAAQRIQPDIIYANSGAAAIVAAPAAILTRRSLIWHQHDIVPNRRTNRVVLGACGRIAARIMSTSQVVADSLMRLAIPANKLEVILPRVRNRVRTPSSAPIDARVTLGLPWDAVLLTVIGRLVPRKGHPVFVDAVRTLVDQGFDVCGLIVGTAPDAPPGEPQDGRYVHDLRQQIARLGLQDRIRFLGYISDIETVLAASDVLIMPSYHEPFGLVIVEAFAAGTPVVAAAAGGPLDIITDGVNGFLSTPGDAASIAAKVSRLLFDVNVRDQIVRNARSEIDLRYSEHSLVEQIERLFTSTAPSDTHAAQRNGQEPR